MFVRHKWFVPFSKLTYTQEMIEAAVKILQKGAFSVSDGGEECLFFEKEFANAFGKKQGVSLASGSAALHLALLACGVGEGDEVLVPPNTCLSVPDAVWMVGAKTVFVDPEYETQNMDPTKIEEQLTPKTKAIIVVHTQGHPADMDPIVELAETHALHIIENTIHAAGGKYKGTKLPVTALAVYGFHHTKSLYLPDGGGGGMVLTDDEKMAEDIELRRYHGMKVTSRSDRSYRVGFNYRMSELAAAIGRIQLRHLEEWTTQQREIAQYYTELLEDTPVTTPVEKEYAYHTYLRYVILAPKRDQLQAYLASQGIQSTVLYDIPLHLETRYRTRFGYKQGDFPVTEKLKEEELGLPCPRFRDRWEVEYVVQKIKEFYA